jgi:hypothetical protein
MLHQLVPNGRLALAKTFAEKFPHLRRRLGDQPGPFSTERLLTC